MKARTLVLAVVLVVPATVRAQVQRVQFAAGDVALESGARDRLAPRVPAVPELLRPRVLVSGDSAQRLALVDFDWRGHALSVELDEGDGRVFWDVKVVPDRTRGTIVRYRVDATVGGIIDIREFHGVRGIAGRP